MKVTAYRIAQNGYDAMVMGFSRPCVISLYKRNVSPLCGSGASNDNNVFRYASHPETQPNGATPPTSNFIYHDGLSIADFYEYFSTIDLSHLTHEQHKTMYAAVAEINDASADCYVEGDEEDKARSLDYVKSTETIEVHLDQCVIVYADKCCAAYSDLH